MPSGSTCCQRLVSDNLRSGGAHHHRKDPRKNSLNVTRPQSKGEHPGSGKQRDLIGGIRVRYRRVSGPLVPPLYMGGEVTAFPEGTRFCRVGLEPCVRARDETLDLGWLA